MAELAFPIAAVALTFLVIIPALTLVSRAYLAYRRRRERSWANFGSETVYAWLVAPTLVPVVWLMSSALHQTEPSQALASCMVTHVSTTCLDAAALLALLIGGAAITIGVRALRERPRLALEPLSPSDPAALRVAAVCARDPRLRKLRVQVARCARPPIFTVGMLRPRVIVDACFVESADDAMLHAALLHEHAHVAAFDTLRGFVARLCLAVNPAGRLLAHDLERWRAAREAQCDGVAVHSGGEPLALAEGILRAARFRCQPMALGASMLCGHDRQALELRLALLLDGPAKPLRTIGHVALAAIAVAAVAVPHVEGAGLLELFHFEVERLLHTIH